MPAIFVSHSVKDDPVASAYLDAIEPHLEALKYEVLLDRVRLRGGDDWNAVITNWMALCQGAVVLLSPAALASHFVKYEVSNLLFRWRREKDDSTLAEGRKLRFCPVLLPGVTIDDVQDGFFGAIRFDEAQFIVADSVKGVLAKLSEAFATLEDYPSPFEQTEALVRAILASVDPDVLVAAATEAGLPMDRLGATGERARRFAYYLMRCPLNRVFLAVQKMRPLLHEQASHLFDLLAPSWVSFEAAQTFSKIVLREENEATDGTAHLRCAVINGEIPTFTPLMYLQRARALLRRDAGDVVTPVSPMGVLVEEALIVSIRRALKEHFVKVLMQPQTRGPAEQKRIDALDLADAAGDANALDKAIAGEVRRRRRNLGKPTVVAVAIAVEDLDIVGAVHQKWSVLRDVTVVALCEPAPLATSALPPGQSLLAPEIGRGQEQQLSEAYMDICNDLGLQ